MSQEQVLLTWTDNSSNEDGFRIYQDFSGCGERTVLLATTTATSIVVNDAMSYMWRGCWQVHLRVVAFNNVGESGPAGPYAGFAIYAPVPKVAVITSYVRLNATQAQITWRHTSTDGFATSWFFLTDDGLGAPLTGNLPYTATTLAYPLVEFTATVNAVPCVRIRARNAYFHAYDWDYSSLSDPACLAPL